MNEPLKSSVAIFPLPNTAVLPGEVLALQIFEPRYRKMIDDVVANDYLLGISLAGKVIHDPELHPGDNLLHRNQKLYEPNAVLGCGPVIVNERMPDGRILVDLHVTQKVEIREIIQTIPFYLGKVCPIETEECEFDQAVRQELINEFLLLVTSIDTNAGVVLNRKFLDLDLEHSIALILSTIRLPGQVKQQLLEQNSWAARGILLLQLLPELFPKIAH